MLFTKKKKTSQKFSRRQPQKKTLNLKTNLKKQSLNLMLSLKKKTLNLKRNLKMGGWVEQSRCQSGSKHVSGI